MSGKILVAGIGNIFLGDDAFGIDVANRLREHSLPGRVTVSDFGIRSYDLAYALMNDWDLAILVDALPRGNDPGTLYLLEPELPKNDEGAVTVDAHSMNPVAVLQLVQAMGGQCAPVLVVGCEPATLEPDPQGNFGLSAPVAAAVDEAIRMIEDLITTTCSKTTLYETKGEIKWLEKS
jgi:hydrogenase maturation protease